MSLTTTVALTSRGVNRYTLRVDADCRAFCFNARLPSCHSHMESFTRSDGNFTPESTYGSQAFGASSASTTRSVAGTRPTTLSASASTAFSMDTPTVMLSVRFEGGSGQVDGEHGRPSLHAPRRPQKQHRGGPACQRSCMQHTYIKSTHAAKRTKRGSGNTHRYSQIPRLL
jgi:hypothetical protein